MPTTSTAVLPTNASASSPPLNAGLFKLLEKLEPVCMYADLVRICPSGSRTIINPPCPCTVMLRNIHASPIKNTSIRSLRNGGLYSALNANATESTKFATAVSDPASPAPLNKSALGYSNPTP